MSDLNEFALKLLAFADESLERAIEQPSDLGNREPARWPKHAAPQACETRHEPPAP